MNLRRIIAMSLLLAFSFGTSWGQGEESWEDLEKHRKQVRRALNHVRPLTVFDLITFHFEGSTIHLGGFTLTPHTRSEAEARVRSLKWVESVENNIEVLPLSNVDNKIRKAAKAKLLKLFPQAFSIRRASIRIKVKRGEVTLYGMVNSKVRAEAAANQIRALPLVRSVENQLMVRLKDA